MSAGFGEALVKTEGTAVYVDAAFRGEDVYVPSAWFERSFTAMEYAELAAILHASGSPLARDVAQHMVECAKEVS
jgi:hypothetical protein